ncbi:MAG: hypothetical protein ABIJ48_10375 [Actinomycetota bacterium]
MSIIDTRRRVQHYLQKAGKVETVEDRVMVRCGSTGCQIQVEEWEKGRTLVVLSAAVLLGVKLTAELFKELAQQTDKYWVGSLVLEEDAGGMGNIFFKHVLLGDTLDEEELLWSLSAVSRTADDLDDEWRPRFGGSRLEDKLRS